MESIIKRLNLWMNYSDNNYNEPIDQLYRFSSKIENGNINVYHINTKQRIAIISPILEYIMVDLKHNNEIEEFNNFLLKQYAHSLLYRILSTI
jgi:hypothetical protein